MNQLRLTCAMKRRIHGPNSTPLVSNWIAGPNCPPPPCGLSNVSLWHVALEVPERVAERPPAAGARLRSPAARGRGSRAFTRLRRGCRSQPMRRARAAGSRCAGSALLSCCGGSGCTGVAVHLNALGRVAAREWHHVPRVGRPLDRARVAVPVGVVGLRRRRPRCWRVEPGLHEHEPPRFVLALPGLGLLLVQGERFDLRPVDRRHQDEGQDGEQVEHERKENALPPGHGGADAVYIWVSFFKIEVHRGPSRSIPPR